MISGKHFILIIILFILIIAVRPTPGFAELTINSTSPTLGKMGEDLEVTVNGSGFDGIAKLYMYLDTENKRKILGSQDTPGNALNATIVGDTAFVADGENGLQIIDVSDPTQPKSIGAVDTQGPTWSVAVAGNIAVLADGNGGVKAVDVSNPYQPSIIGEVGIPGGFAIDVMVIESIAFVADATGLQVVDVSNPSGPAILGSAATPGGARGLYVAGDTAYVAEMGGSLRVIDVSDPSHPDFISAVYLPGMAGDVTIADQTAFVVCTNNSLTSLQVIDISDKSNPVIIGAVETGPGLGYDVTVEGDTAFVACGVGGIQLVDVSDVDSPIIIGTVETPSEATSATVFENRAYITSLHHGLLMIDISDPSLPTTIGSVDTPGYSETISIVDHIALVADRGIGLQVIDISIPSNPSIIGSLNTQYPITDIEVVGNVAFVTAGFLYLIDIANPSNPSVISTVQLPYPFSGVAVSADSVFVTAFGGGLQIIDASDVYNPEFLGSLDTPDNALSVVTVNGTAFVADYQSGLQVIDVSDRVHPEITGSVNTPGYASDVAVVNNIAYVADWNSGLQIIDVSDRAHPAIIGSVNTPVYNATDVKVKGSTAYLANGYSGVQVIEVSDPHHPAILYSIRTPGGAWDVDAIDDKIFVAEGINGITIFPMPYKIERITELEETEIHATLPSPQIPGHYNLRIMNETGSDELVGAITFVDEEEYQSHIRDKAIILAGRTDTADTLWESTKSNATYAYNSLLFQGYSHETIFLLCSENIDVDGDGNSDTDLDATRANLNHAFDTWVLDPDSPTNDLVFYMIGHSGQGQFQVNPTETVSSQEISAFLDAVEPHLDGELVFIYDACLSGSFFDALTPGPTGRRIVMTSTSEDESASFLNDGKTSFSYRFWNDIYKGYKVGYAFVRARSEMSPYHQNALIHNDAFANTVYIGIGKVVAPIGPRIIELAPDTLTLDGETSATISATIDSSNSVKYVKATIIPPDIFLYPPEEPITDLPEVLLTDSDEDGTYEGLYDCFTKAGLYTIMISAEDKNNQRSYGADRIITITQQTATVEPGDMNADCLINLADVITALKAVTDAPVQGIQVGADLNDDDQIGIIDAILLLREISKL